MQCITRVCLALGLAAACAVSVTWADVPHHVNVSGRLTDDGGNPVAPGAKDFTFKIYDAEVGGTEIWPAAPGEEQTLTTDTHGLWNAHVGAVVALTEVAFQDTSRWLEITVDDGVNPPETLPRTRLSTTPYAFRVSTVDGATGGVVSGDVAIQSDLSVSGKATIGPGHTNTGDYALAVGQNNVVTGLCATIPGGITDTATGNYAVVAGGRYNAARDHATTIGGGQNNKADSQYATVGGGGSNNAVGTGATVGGGVDNTADTIYAVVAGGRQNLAGSYQAAVGGGGYNLADDNSATVGGGDHNEATGPFATVPGGRFNEATGAWSFAAGRRAKALHGGSFVWADQTDADFSSTGLNQFLIRASGDVGIGTADPQDVTSGTDVTIAGMIAQEVWTNASLQSGWTNVGGNYAPAGYYRDKSGVVHLRGHVNGSSSPAPVFTLPSGYRPEFWIECLVYRWGGAGPATLVVESGTGTVRLLGTGTISLDNVTFRATDL
jgi:hypothetical protein